jgi:hypothetical protein
MCGADVAGSARRSVGDPPGVVEAQHSSGDVRLLRLPPADGEDGSRSLRVVTLRWEPVGKANDVTTASNAHMRRDYGHGATCPGGGLFRELAVGTAGEVPRAQKLGITLLRAKPPKGGGAEPRGLQRLRSPCSPSRQRLDSVVEFLAALFVSSRG